MTDEHPATGEPASDSVAEHDPTYGLDLPESQLEHVANLDVPQNCMLKDLTVNTIIDRTMAVTGGR